MKTEKITYEVIIADSFNEGPRQLSAPVGESIYRNDISFTFESKGEGNMKYADSLLESWMKENYPTKDYRIYYWWWGLETGEPRFTLEGVTINE